MHDQLVGVVALLALVDVAVAAARRREGPGAPNDDAEQNAKPEPLRGEMQALLRQWQTRLLRIILNPAMVLAWGFGLWLIHLDVAARGAGAEGAA